MREHLAKVQREMVEIFGTLTTAHRWHALNDSSYCIIYCIMKRFHFSHDRISDVNLLIEVSSITPFSPLRSGVNFWKRKSDIWDAFCFISINRGWRQRDNDKTHELGQETRTPGRYFDIEEKIIRCFNSFFWSCWSMSWDRICSFQRSFLHRL